MQSDHFNCKRIWRETFSTLSVDWIHTNVITYLVVSEQSTANSNYFYSNSKQRMFELVAQIHTTYLKNFKRYYFPHRQNYKYYRWMNSNTGNMIWALDWTENDYFPWKWWEKLLSCHISYSPVYKYGCAMRNSIRTVLYRLTWAIYEQLGYQLKEKCHSEWKWNDTFCMYVLIKKAIIYTVSEY